MKNYELSLPSDAGRATVSGVAADDGRPREGERSAALILDSVAESVITIDTSYRITSFNRAAESLTGLPRAQVLGRRCRDVFQSDMCRDECAMRRTMKTGEPCCDLATYVIPRTGSPVPVTVTTAVLRNEAGVVVGGVKTLRDMSQVEELRRESKGRTHVGSMTSHSPAMQRIFAILPRVAECDCTVLVHGETGTGKEVVARMIHDLSPRRNRPFVPIDCGALPDALLESELFGHRAGAFTGANRDKPGYFAAADGGTVFLDEIDGVSPALQARLLRVLQERTYRPLGSAETRVANVRVIVATKDGPDELLESGRLRQDLYYRVNVMSIELPPLRRRLEDIPLLVAALIGRHNQSYGTRVTGMAPEALGRLMTHDYPGNVRELENIVQRCLVFCQSGQIAADMLPALGTAEPTTAPRAMLKDTVPPDTAASRPESEAEAIRQALRRHGNNRLAAARWLGMHRATLYRKMARYGIALPAADGRAAACASHAAAGYRR